MNLRVGLGYDVHQLAPGRPCKLGGVLFDSPIGPLGHSDADVLLHAICDAILGAAGLRDIGFHFPNTDPSFHNADSLNLLKEVMKLAAAKGYSVVNIDATVIAEAPKIAPRIADIKATIAHACGLETECIGVKATTGEKMGFVGRGEGIEAMAVVLMCKT